MHAPGSHSSLRFLVLSGLTTLVIGLVCAAIVTYQMHVGIGFKENLVFSMCIAGIGMLLINAGQRLILKQGKPDLLRFTLLLAVAVPVAYASGAVIAAWLLDLPQRSVMAEVVRNAKGFILLEVLVSLFLVWFFWNRTQFATLEAAAESEKARAAAIERQAMQAQLQLLQAQIEPHMLFNTLANLQGLIAIDPPRAQHMLDQLIQYLRATLSSSRTERTTLVQEFSLLEAYLGLMSVRMGARLSYALTLRDELRDATVPPMLLQPLVENAIKHGLEPKLGGGHIDVSATLESGKLRLTVSDTGLGLENTMPASAGTRVGITNVQERLQALYGQQASFSLVPNTPCGAIAQLELPLSS